MVFIQSQSVNIKIAGGGEPGLVIMLFIIFNEKVTSVSGNSIDMRHRTLLEKLFSMYNIFKERIF